MSMTIHSVESADDRFVAITEPDQGFSRMALYASLHEGKMLLTISNIGVVGQACAIPLDETQLKGFIAFASDRLARLEADPHASDPAVPVTAEDEHAEVSA